MEDTVTTPVEIPILNALKSSNTFISSREIGCRLRTANIPVADYKVTRLLRKMAREGQVEYKRGRWKITESQSQPHSFSISSSFVDSLNFGRFDLLSK